MVNKFDPTNRFAIWPNRDKRPDKQDADFTGTINIDGVEYWLNAWKRKPDAKEGAPSLSGTVKRKGQPSEHPAREQARQAAGLRPDNNYDQRGPDDFDDSIPF